jgi:60 kDa SS-A/Ro ribonucleoprotein
MANKTFPGKVYVLPDILGSTHSAVTGFRAGSTSKVRFVDVAALVAATVLRKNPDAEVIPFESNVVKVRLNPRDSIMTNAKKLASKDFLSAHEVSGSLRRSRR